MGACESSLDGDVHYGDVYARRNLGRAHQPLPISLALISLAAAGHEGWSTNLFYPVRSLPKHVVGSVVGPGGTFAPLGMIMILLAGGFLQWLGSYVPLFFTAGLMHPLALLFVAFAGKNMAPANIEEALRPPQRSWPASTVALIT